MTPGPRQTVSRVRHPLLGEGTLVYGNGPAFFTPDVGDVLPLAKADMGGFTSTPRRSWDVGRTMSGERVEFDIIARGDRHQRVFSPAFGEGWLVDLATPRYRQRFDADSGQSFEFEHLEICVGRPAYAAKMKRSHTRMPKQDDPDEMSWFTITARNGEVYTFRRDGAPPKVETQLSLGDRS